MSLVLIAADIGAAGAVTIDADASSPDTTITLDTTGDYDITFPACESVHVVGVALDNADDTPDAADAFVAAPVNVVATGTGKILVCATDDGLVAAPDDGARLYVTLLCCNS